MKKLSREACVTQGGQAIYTIVTLLPPVLVLYDSKFWSDVYLLFLFAVSVWNGASFYSKFEITFSHLLTAELTICLVFPLCAVEVFSRRFEKVSIQRQYSSVS